MENSSNETIKTFLKIDSPNFQDKPYYSINKDKKILTIFHPVDKAPSDKSSDFEQDRIFTENDETSFIYEEICKNTIDDIFNGISFSFITYGDSNSNKLKLLIGDYKNYNNIGLFPKLLHNLIRKVKTTEKNVKEKMSLKISYFLEYNGDMIDLCNFRSKNKEKDMNNFTEEKLFEGKQTIKNEENISDMIKRVNVEGFKEEINYLNHIFNLLNKIEEKDNNKNIFTRGYICIVLFVENKDKTSIINFIILNGSEYLYSGKAEEFKSLINNNNRNAIEGTKIALETQYTYETLLNLVKLKLYIDNNVDSSNQKEIDLILNKNKQNSKLTTLLYNFYFNTKKMYFRIIGTVIPNIGFYQSFKDTLIFLLDFHKLKKKSLKNLIPSLSSNIYSEIKRKNVSVNFKRQSGYYNQLNNEDKKDNYIIELKNKVNSYKKIIDEQKLNINKKDSKIELLTKMYHEQISVMKKKFNFTGDINVLIAGDENTKEAKFIRSMREAAENNIRNESNLRLLQKKLEKQDEEMKKLKNKEQMIDSNDTMIKYYISVQQMNEEKNKKDKEINKLRNVIEELNKKLELKDKIIDNYKKEIENKSKILFNLPKCLKESYSNNILDEKKNATNNNLEDENNIVKNKSMETDILYNEEMEKIKKENQKKLDIMKLNYENLIKEKNDIIKQLEFDFDGLKLEKNNEINKYGNELIKINKILMSLISNYKRIFLSNTTEKYSLVSLNNKKEEFNNIILNINDDINFTNFPLLYKFLLKKKQLDVNQPLISKNYKKIYSPMKKIEKKEEEKDKKKEKEKGLENDLKSNVLMNNEQLLEMFKEETNEGKIIFSKEKLEEMSKEAIVLYCININNKLNNIEKYLEKYIQYKKGFNVEEFEMGNKYKEQIIEELKNKIKKLSVNLDEQTKINNQNVYVLNSQNRKIDRLEKDSIIYKNLLNMKKISSSLIQPNRSTLYKSSTIEFNSINSNNSISKNNIILKKSSSLVNINKSRQPTSQKVIKILRKNQSNDFSRPISSKIKYFTINK